MPQINFYTYLSQTTWTIILFSLFYIIMKQYFLPLIFESLKVKTLILKVTSKSSKKSESFKGYNNLI